MSVSFLLYVPLIGSCCCISLPESHKGNVLRRDYKPQGYCSVGYARVVERSEKFDSIKYKDLRSEKHTYKSKNRK